LNASLVQQLNLTAGHVHIVVALTIIPASALITPLLYRLIEKDNQLLLIPNSNLPLPTLPYAETTTNQIVTMQTADIFTGETTVVGPTKATAVQEMGSPPFLNLIHGLHYNCSSSNVN